ncbi:MAG: ATP-binding cassette domain-containing protein [Dysgonamonadaceae bacterium]|jgi:zinc transport system ATP-binding protein|nr:ATP-binding cassette domain-containing protein [Dysgonamonadaceae bacterium]
MNNALVEIKQVCAGYDHKTVLKDVSLTIYERDFLGIIGPNGGGKTTLLKVILGLLRPFSGEVVQHESLKQRIGYMPQTNSIDKRFPILVSEVVESGLIAEKGLSGQEKKALVKAMLVTMGIEQLASQPIGKLSGGQLQRTLLARAVINQPALLILDEPNSYVDKRFETNFYGLLQELNKATSIVLVSHDVGSIVSTVKNIACVDETLHYHAGTDIDEHWLEAHYDCPLDLIGHGAIPHRILKSHD